MSAVASWSDLRARLRPEGDCLVFTGARREKGYGVTRYQGRSRSTHRLSWELHNGPIPDGLLVLHTCDNPPCCRIEHLTLGTHQDNERDAMARGRTRLRARFGSQSHSARLTDEEVTAIRALAGTATYTDIARRFGISKGHARLLILERRRPTDTSRPANRSTATSVAKLSGQRASTSSRPPRSSTLRAALTARQRP